MPGLRPSVRRACCRLAVFLESCVTTSRAAGAASCLLCHRELGRRSRLWADLRMCCYFILLLGSELGARRGRRATESQTQQQPPDAVANRYSVMKVEALGCFLRLPDLGLILFTRTSPGFSWLEKR